MDMLSMDAQRYPKGDMPQFQKYFRLQQQTVFPPLRLFYRAMYKYLREKSFIEIPPNTKIGGGLYIGHPYCITVNPAAILGCNINLHKGVTIGQENRGPREGAPTIGDCVWIGANSTVVGNIKIGNDVLIAANTLVNRDVPDHSVVFGNPCQIRPRDNATENYVCNKVQKG